MIFDSKRKSSIEKMHMNLYSVFLLFLLHQAHTTLGPGDKKKAKKEPKESRVQEPPAAENKPVQQLTGLPIFDLDLVNAKIKLNEIIDYHGVFCKECTHEKHFGNKVLGYVTPWNSKGYDLSKRFADKLDMISPVWLQIERVGRKKYELKGKHDIDKEWMDRVINNAEWSSTEFMPRILFENLKPNDLHALFNGEEESQALGKLFINFSGFTVNF